MNTPTSTTSLPSRFSARQFRAASASLLLAITALPLAQAADGNWNVNANGNWSTATNWNSNPTVPGTAAGDTVGLTFDLSGSGKTVTIDQTVTLGTLNIGDTNASNSYTLALSAGSLTFNNNGSSAALNVISTSALTTTITAPFTLGDNLVVSNNVAGILSVTGVISGTKSLTLNTGALTLTAANTYSGGTIVNGGSFRINTVNSNANAVTTLNSGSLVIGNNNVLGTTASSSLIINGGTIAPSGATARNIASSVTMAGNVILGDAVGTAALTFSGPVNLGAATRTFTLNNAADTISGVVSNGALTKAGAGILTLSGTNTYTGGTNVNAGTLTFARANTLSGANSISVAATGVAGTNYATVISSVGALTFGGTLDINLSASLLGGETFNLFQATTGTLAGNFSTVSVSGSYLASLNNSAGIWTGTGSGFDFTFNSGNGNLTVALSAVPEPATYASFAGLGILGFAIYRRRKQS